MHQAAPFRAKRPAAKNQKFSYKQCANNRGKNLDFHHNISIIVHIQLSNGTHSMNQHSENSNTHSMEIAASRELYNAISNMSIVEYSELPDSVQRAYDQLWLLHNSK